MSQAVRERTLRRPRRAGAQARVSLVQRIGSNRRLALFILMLPGVLHFLLFRYVPLLGNVIAFQNYDIFAGILGSKWVGVKHFASMFSYVEFYHIIRNTLLISFMSLTFGFPAPLCLALLLNEIPTMRVKRPVQTVLYLPHFLSWVIVGGIFINLLKINGIVNQLIAALGLTPVGFVTEPAWFRWVLVGVGIWREVGWGMIIYLAALAGVDPNLYEAAVVDGANRWRQVWHITLPSLRPAIVVLFLLRIGHLLDSNVEQVLIFLNPLVRDVGEVVDTYVYRVGLLSAQFSYTTAVGIFKSVVGIALIVGLNNLSKRLTGESIY